MIIVDKRTAFNSTTFSNYKKSHVIKELLNSLYYQKKEEAYFWTGDLLCSGFIIDLWNIYINFICKYIHINNPKMPIYINKKYNEFKIIANKINDFDLRNNDEIRNIFFSIATILLECKKDSIMDDLKFNVKFDIQTNLKAPNILYIQPFFKQGDPKEYFIALNEFVYHLKESKNKMDVLYWIEWIIEYELALLKKKKHTICVQREFAPNTNIIWILWEIFFSYKTDNVLEKIIQSLFNLFRIKYTTSTNKKKKCILHLCVMFIINNIDYQIKLIDNIMALNSVDSNIKITFEKLKKNEIAS